MSPAAKGTPSAVCANWARDAWNVGLAADSATLVTKFNQSENRGDTLNVIDGFLIGDDRGEFGGALWWQGRHGERDTLLVEGRDTSEWYADNLHGFVRHTGATYALVGLAHLSLNSGELLVLSEESPGHWRARHALSLSGEPRAHVRAGGDTILVLTTDSLFAVTLHSIMPKRHAIYGNSVWADLYASSLVRNRFGTIYIGMRSAVSRLTPTTNGYVEDWLVPTVCRRRAGW